MKSAGPWIAVIVAVIALVIGTRWLSMKEQKANDDSDWAQRLARAVDSTKIETFRIWREAARADTQSSSARTGTRTATSKTHLHGGGDGTDSLSRADIDSLEAQNERLSLPKSTDFTFSDSATVHVDFDPMETMDPFTAIYKAAPQFDDSTVVNRLRYVENPVPGWTTGEFFGWASAMAVVFWAVMHFVLRL
jgi:hypothetical protein